MTVPSDCPPAGAPRLVALELTRRCVLTCRHCRAAASADAVGGELMGAEWRGVLDSIAGFARPTIILTGGEPLLREDVCDIAAHATGRGLRVVLATCGAVLDEATARRLVRAGVSAISISLDGATAESHDGFRGVAGAFAAAMGGVEAAKGAGLPFQINTTVTRRSAGELADILELAARLGATTFNPFLLVPTGRGRELAGEALSAEEYERTLNWLADRQAEGRIPIRVTCAPHYQRVLRQQGPAARTDAKGCMGGQTFAFVSHRGVVQACGFLEVAAGDVREAGWDFARVWRESAVFAALRDPTRYGGRCGACEFLAVCGGCRARALQASGDYLGEEPLCLHRPRRAEAAALDAVDGRLIWEAQVRFPIEERPFAALGERMGIGEAEVLERLRRLREAGVVRRIGAVFDSRRLGYVSTLVAARVPPERLAEVAAMAGALPGVTHNYSRRHRYNLWFTLTATSEAAIDAAIADLRRRSGIDDVHALPAERVYKIQAVFAPPGIAVAPLPPRPTPPPAAQAGPAALDAAQREIVRRLGGDLPLVERPFEAAAAELGVAAETLLEQVKRWLAEGVIRRMGAVASHRRVGYVANGMGVFAVRPERIDEGGAAAAGRADVSHVYRRRPFEGFPYNLFAMIHGRTEEDVRRAAAQIAAAAGADDYDVLMTEREFAKTSPAFFA